MGPFHNKLNCIADVALFMTTGLQALGLTALLPGNANPNLAGREPSYICCSGGSVHDQSPILIRELDRRAGPVLHRSVTGEVTHRGSAALTTTRTATTTSTCRATASKRRWFADRQHRSGVHRSFRLLQFRRLVAADRPGVSYWQWADRRHVCRRFRQRELKVYSPSGATRLYLRHC